MDTFLYFFFAAAYLLLLIWGMGQQKTWNMMSFVFLVVLGLIYDNGIIALGKFIGEGALLESLSRPRFWIHALLTPTLVLFSWGALDRAGVEWVKKAPVLAGAVLCTLALIAIEFVLETVHLDLKSASEYGVVRYVSADPATGPPVMVLLLTAVLIFSGAVLWRLTGWKWMLAGSVVMVIGSAVPMPLESSAATNAFELFLLVTLVWTKAHLESTKVRR
ncbi:hypothetical protein [Planomicrobium sp. CPCC 101110]|uniref:hypothetical protein n=1 Tax=Planomicrobium sp. CPCC 101110 TaxID=2599619 RepID=UPI0011B5DE21|nr:hypothetical protein [Planomicrobium sp. CPCC 101110]TWT24760.1 hypothetical protein FQV30_14780 [Planomicrobium sp. CPCC 101110]